jgi:alkylation response protein AidB-like acyl-CoA dehydrogenase
MNFSLTEEQQLLSDSLTRFIARAYGFEQRRAIQRSPAGYSDAVWIQLAEMGVLALPLPVEHGGFGGSAADLMPVMNVIGQALMVEPYLATVVLGAGLVAAAGSAAQKAQILPAVAEGKLRLAFAHSESSPVRAQHSPSGWKLDGRKVLVLHGAQADKLVVSAGDNLFLLERATQGVAVRDYRTIDGLRAADISLTDVELGADALLGPEGGSAPMIAAVLDRAVAALCAEAIGVMEQLNAQTLAYLKSREQFGQSIGRFQALQHRAVDMFIGAEQSKSMAYLAALRADSPDATERRRDLGFVRAYIARVGRRLAQEAIQLHGGMGVTDELPISHYAKRLSMIGVWLSEQSMAR